MVPLLRRLLRRLLLRVLATPFAPDIEPDDPWPKPSKPKGVLVRRRLLLIRRLMGETPEPPPRRAQRALQEASTQVVDTSPGSRTLLDSGAQVRVKRWGFDP